MQKPIMMTVCLFTCALPGLAAPTRAANGPAQGTPAARQGETSTIRVRRFSQDHPLDRARRPAGLSVELENAGQKDVDVDVRLALPAGVTVIGLALPAGVTVIGGPAGRTARLAAGNEATLSWTVEADGPTRGEARVDVRLGAEPATVATATLPLSFLPQVEPRRLSSVPEPQPVATRLLIGAHNCPLWEADKPEMWANILKHPGRTPALGFYAQENPEVADWETKWAVEHGISFFIYCWYRDGQGGAVRTHFGSAIHDSLFRSKFVGKMKFTIMWENQVRGQAGVADQRDLMTNLMPYWVENYFKHPSYLKVDNKPVLFVYRPEFLIDDLGGVENVARAFAMMRQACRNAGFDGLYLLGEYRGLDPDQLRLMKRLGLDYTFAYCWYVPNSPKPEQAIRAQMADIRKTQELHILPQVVTVSQGWSGWQDEGSIWSIPPHDYESLLRQAGEFVSTLPANELGSRMLLLDNWNEWGEGHYIAPHRENGFGYLDAVRKVFAAPRVPHVDLLPEDVGLGPYDSAFRARMHRDETLRRLRTKRTIKNGPPEHDLIAWWPFDEGPDDPVALDGSGHRLGGEVHKATRARGIDGNALVCQGGCVLVEPSPSLSPATALTIECWVKTEQVGQENVWLVNRVLSGGTASGYRLGVLEGKPCFEIPVTDWSHHLKASEALPTGRWVHLAGTYDGHTMRIFVDGLERGSLARPGPIHANDLRLCLGSYDVDHPAHFTGLLDEVKLYGRALSEGEVREHYRQFADRAGLKSP